MDPVSRALDPGCLRGVDEDRRQPTERSLPGHTNMTDSANDPDDSPPISILFVCLGNICRSPLAEGIARHMVRERGLLQRITVESAGTGAWHVGEPPDPRSTEVARRNGVELEGRARQLRGEDLFDFDFVVAMDGANLSGLQAIQNRNGGTARVQLLRDWDPDPGDGEVPDPYYGGDRGFDDVFDLVHRSVAGLLDEVEDAVG